MAILPSWIPDQSRFIPLQHSIREHEIVCAGLSENIRSPSTSISQSFYAISAGHVNDKYAASGLLRDQDGTLDRLIFRLDWPAPGVIYGLCFAFCNHSRDVCFDDRVIFCVEHQHAIGLF
jgi:hypothetical protein